MTDVILWKALWLPPAIVADTLLMPWYVVSYGGCSSPCFYSGECDSVAPPHTVPYESFSAFFLFFRFAA